MKKNKVLDNFIVFEGLDGSGTTTQLNLLSNKLKENRIPFWTTSEPTTNPIGLLIRKILTREESVEPKTLAFLFASDRNEHLHNPEDGIIAHLRRGNIVITDRYLFSSLAYQSEECGFEFVYSLNSDFPLPKHLFFLDASSEVCQKRIKTRSSIELFDDIRKQEKIRSWYQYAFRYVKQQDMNLYYINGDEREEFVFEKIWSILAHHPIR